MHADVSHEKTKRGPPTKKNISVRNIKAQITNMSDNENSGFKTEYNVIIYVLDGIQFQFLSFLVNIAIYIMIYETYNISL